MTVALFIRLAMATPIPRPTTSRINAGITGVRRLAVPVPKSDIVSLNVPIYFTKQTYFTTELEIKNL